MYRPLGSWLQPRSGPASFKSERVRTVFFFSSSHPKRRIALPRRRIGRAPKEFRRATKENSPDDAVARRLAPSRPWMSNPSVSSMVRLKFPPRRRSLVALLRHGFEGQPSCRCCTQSQRHSSLSFAAHTKAAWPSCSISDASSHARSALWQQTMNGFVWCPNG